MKMDDDETGPDELEYIMTVYDEINMLIRKMEADLNEEKISTNDFNAITKNLKAAKKTIEEIKKKQKADEAAMDRIDTDDDDEVKD